MVGFEPITISTKESNAYNSGMNLEDLFSGDGDISTSDKLLYIISKNSDEGVLDGRKKLTKLVFFTEFLDIDQDRLSTSKKLGDFDFIIYKYGPFSHDLMDDFDNLKDEGFIQENQSSYTYDIHLTEKGEGRLEEIMGELDEDELDQIRKVSDHFADLDGGTLENLSLEYLGITKEEKQNYIGMPIDVILSETTFGS